MIVDFGYGVDTSRVEFKQDAAKYILKNFASQDVLDEFEGYCADNADLVEDGTAEEMFVEEYEDSVSYATGICGLIVRCINDNECGGADIFEYDDYCIYLGVRIPTNDAEKAKMLTQEDVRRILAKYLNPILRCDVNIEHLSINN